MEQYRELLKQATKIDTLDDTEIKKLADECEKIFNGLYNAVQQEKIIEEKTGRICRPFFGWVDCRQSWLCGDHNARKQRGVTRQFCSYVQDQSSNI